MGKKIKENKNNENNKDSGNNNNINVERNENMNEQEIIHDNTEENFNDLIKNWWFVSKIEEEEKEIQDRKKDEEIVPFDVELDFKKNEII